MARKEDPSLLPAAVPTAKNNAINKPSGNTDSNAGDNRKPEPNSNSNTNVKSVIDTNVNPDILLTLIVLRSIILMLSLRRTAATTNI